MRHFVFGLALGLIVGLLAGGAGWYLYDASNGDSSQDDAGLINERQRADETASQALQDCAACTLASLERLEPGAWRLIIEADGERYCVRMDLDELEGLYSDSNDVFSGGRGFRKTACA